MSAVEKFEGNGGSFLFVPPVQYAPPQVPLNSKSLCKNMARALGGANNMHPLSGWPQTEKIRNGINFVTFLADNITNVHEFKLSDNPKFYCLNLISNFLSQLRNLIVLVSSDINQQLFL